MSYTLYDPNSGSILGVVSNIEDYKGYNFVRGSYDSKDYMVKNGNITKKPTPPSGPSWHVYNYNESTHEWTLNKPASAAKAKELRRSYFKYVDKVNPIWLASMNAIQQLQVANFRQDLLDITDQPGYPVQIQWPIIPDFLK